MDPEFQIAARSQYEKIYDIVAPDERTFVVKLMTQKQVRAGTSARATRKSAMAPAFRASRVSSVKVVAEAAAPAATATEGAPSAAPAAPAPTAQEGEGEKAPAEVRLPETVSGFYTHCPCS